MKTLAAVAALSLLSAPDDDQDVREALAPYEKTIRDIAGVLEITVGTVRGRRGILIRVENARARDSVQFLCGEKLGEVPVLAFIGSIPPRSPDGTCGRCVVHCGAGRTVAAPPPPTAGPG